MIQQETVTFNGREFRRTYSDEGYLIQKVGTDEVYSEAYDLPEYTYTYIETAEKAEVVAEEDEVLQVEITGGGPIE